jgi:hypothetical protein
VGVGRCSWRKRAVCRQPVQAVQEVLCRKPSLQFYNCEHTTCHVCITHACCMALDGPSSKMYTSIVGGGVR